MATVWWDGVAVAVALAIGFGNCRQLSMNYSWRGRGRWKQYANFSLCKWEAQVTRHFFFRIYFTAVSSNQSKSNRRRQIVRGVAARWWNQQQQKEKVNNNNNNNNNNNRKKIFINFERVQSSIDIGALETAHVTQKLKRRCQLCWKSFFSRCFGAILHLLLPFFLHFFTSCNAALMNIDYRCPKNPRKESPRISSGVKSINIQMVHSGHLKRFQFIWENSIQFRE